ncbi:GNAT family N-acetyltransferase [Arsenicicoccus piscis]|uniref:GNAT family N-acetyltransferase n=1 Tax=Arsenicicoccus piscis TaxID=673954 RepID=UPI001F4C5ABC|nr:GNAT family N-acetyltransferase [Arsenicicoccus piscis]MCH8627428.1 GNAT family N-acetyltransferase [Arsenicicoccus piscis]
MSANLEVPRAPEDAVWRFRSLTIHDGPALAEVRAAAMRPSLERLGRYDDTRVRQRFLDAFDPTCAWGMERDGRLIGCVALRPEGDEYWLEHFLLLPEHQGQGIGSQVLAIMLQRAGGATVRLDVLQRSEARALYDRFGFEVDHEDPVDVFMVRAAAVGGGHPTPRRRCRHP